MSIKYQIRNARNIMCSCNKLLFVFSPNLWNLNSQPSFQLNLKSNITPIPRMLAWDTVTIQFVKTQSREMFLWQRRCVTLNMIWVGVFHVFNCCLTSWIYINNFIGDTWVRFWIFNSKSCLVWNFCQVKFHFCRFPKFDNNYWHSNSLLFRLSPQIDFYQVPCTSISHCRSLDSIL